MKSQTLFGRLLVNGFVYASMAAVCEAALIEQDEPRALVLLKMVFAGGALAGFLAACLLPSRHSACETMSGQLCYEGGRLMANVGLLTVARFAGASLFEQHLAPPHGLKLNQTARAVLMQIAWQLLVQTFGASLLRGIDLGILCDRPPLPEVEALLPATHYGDVYALADEAMLSAALLPGVSYEVSNF